MVWILASISKILCCGLIKCEQQVYVGGNLAVSWCSMHADGVNVCMDNEPFWRLFPSVRCSVLQLENKSNMYGTGDFSERAQSLPISPFFQVTALSTAAANDSQNEAAQQQQQQQLESQVRSLKQQLNMQEAAMEQLLQARDEATKQLGSTKQQLEAEQAALAGQRAAAAALERRVSELSSELQQREASLAAAQAEAEQAGQQLRVVNQARLQLSASSHESQEAGEELRKQTQALLGQLRDLQDTKADISRERDMLQVGCSAIQSLLLKLD